jgi:predicted tellurium resistance membrane protein TerC
MENLDVILNLITLTGLEIVLGIDNVIFIALLVQHLPKHQRRKARTFGLGLALFLRVLMLLGISWFIKLKETLFSLFNFDFSGRNILLIVGGLFLVVKGFMELKEMFEEEPKGPSNSKASDNYFKVISQIIFIDLVLSFDSVITAVAMSPDNITVIITAIFIAMIVMMVSSGTIGDFINAHPSIKVIALNFILLVGVMLVANGFDYYFSKGYLYFAMFFTLVTEMINIKLSEKKALEKQK